MNENRKPDLVPVGQVMAGALLLGPGLGALCVLLSDWVQTAFEHGVGLYPVKMILFVMIGAYTVGLVPAFLGGALFASLQRWLGPGYGCAFISGFLAMMIIFVVQKGVHGPAFLLVQASAATVKGAVPALLTLTAGYAFAGRMGGPQTGLRLPIGWRTALPLCVALTIAGTLAGSAGWKSVRAAERAESKAAVEEALKGIRNAR